MAYNPPPTMNTNYHNRIRAAAWVSVILHVLLAVCAWWYRPAFTFGPSAETGTAVTVSLAPRPDPNEEQDPKRFVEMNAPATEPVKPTDLIAVQNSNASDLTAHQGEHQGPTPELVAEMPALGGKKGAAPSAPQPEPAPQSAEQAAAEEKALAAADTPAAKKAPAVEDAPATVAAQESPQPKPETGAEEAKTPPIQMADARTSPSDASAKTPAPAADGPPGDNRPEDSPTRGAANSGVRKVGVLGFEALQSEIAPYLKRVQDAVEKHWRETLLTKYNGSNAVRAEIDCEIAADGRIVSLKVAGTPDDRIYAALCKEAIEKAGPFGPFPFVVPDMYRNRNLEIRWSFNFL